MSTVEMGQARKCDEYDVDFEDTRKFVAWRYRDIIEIISETLTEEDRLTVQEERSWQDLLGEIRMKIMDSNSSASLRRVISSLQPFPRSMVTLNGSFISAISPEDVSFSFLWGLVHLNLKLSYNSTEKLRRTVEWLGNVRHVVELFNRCLDVCEDLNEPRLAMIEMYDHILSMLGQALGHLRGNPTDADAAKAWPQLNNQLSRHFVALDSTVKYLNEITIYSRVNMEQTIKSLSARYAPIPESEEHTSFPCNKLPFQQNYKFFGRDAEIQKIADYLNPKRDVSELRTYFLYGRRGVGKTEIALQYAHDNPSRFDAIFWVQCETSVSLRQSFTDIAVALELPGADRTGHHEENLLAVQKWLKLTSKKWLLIFDNAEDEAIMKGYWPVGAKGSILITSRKYHNFMKDNQRKGDTVKPFNDQQSFDLLLLLLGDDWGYRYKNSLLPQSEIDAAMALLTRIGGVALAIQQASLLINDPSIGDSSIAGTLELFDSNIALLPERPETDRPETFNALDTLWSMSFQTLTPNARCLLSVLAMLSPDSMLVDLFLPKNQSALNGKLSFLQKQAQTHIDESSEQKADVVSSPALEAAQTELRAHGLIRRDDQNISVHRVVQEATNYHSMEDLQASFDAAVALVYESFPKAWTGDILHDKWPICQIYITHGVHICQKYAEYTKPTSKVHLAGTNTFTALMANCAWYLYEIGDYETCLKLVDVASGACEDKSSARFANLRNTAGTCYFDMNRLQDCRRDYEIALPIQEKEDEHDEGRVAYMLHNMGNLETGCRRYDEAQDYFTKAIAIRVAQGSRGASQLALTYLCMGRLLYFRRKYDRAMKYLAASEALFVRTTGADTHLMAFVHFAYGNIDFAQERWRGAKRAYQDALAIATTKTPIHFITSAIYYSLGCVELALKNNDAAKSYLNKALRIAELRSPSRDDGFIARILFKKAQVLENDILTGYEAQQLRARADVARKSLIGAGEGYVVQIMDEDGNMDLDEEDAAYDALVPIFFR